MLGGERLGERQRSLGVVDLDQGRDGAGVGAAGDARLERVEQRGIG